jgi:hypothetical protein
VIGVEPTGNVVVTVCGGPTTSSTILPLPNVVVVEVTFPFASFTTTVVCADTVVHVLEPLAAFWHVSESPVVKFVTVTVVLVSA